MISKVRVNLFINNLHKFFLTYLILLCIVQFIFVVWSIDKGFDLADEGLYFSLIQGNANNHHSIFNYNLIFRLLRNLLGLEISVIEARLLSFCISILSTLLLVVFLQTRMSLNFYEKIILVISSFFVFTFLAPTLSYNNITLFIYLAFCILLWLCITSSRYFFVYVFIGVLISIEYLVKVPTSIIMISITLAVIIIKDVGKWILTLNQIVFLILGFLVPQIFFGLVFPEYSMVGVLEDILLLSSKYDHSHENFSLVKRILAALKWCVTLHISGFFLAISLDKSRTALIRNLLFLASILLLFYFVVNHIQNTRFDFGNYTLVASVSFFLGFSIYFLRKDHIILKNLHLLNIEYFIYIILYFAPFICLVGSNSYFFRSAQLYMIFWVLLILLIQKRYKQNGLFVFYRFIPFFIIYTILTWRIYDNLIKNPFNQVELSSDFIEYKYGNKFTIMLDQDKVEYLNSLRAKVNSIIRTNQKNLVGFYGMPGHIVLIDKINFFNPYAWNQGLMNFWVDKARNEDQLKNVDLLLCNDEALIPFLETQLDFVKVDSVFEGGQRVFLLTYKE